MMIAATMLISLGAVAVMGFANQRGATCVVRAVIDILKHRPADHMLALLEASLWVGGGLAALLLLLVHTPVAAGYAPGLWTVLGGILLGVGASINGGCMFGTIARIGAGDWAYVATPVGYFLGCWLFVRTVGYTPAPALRTVAPSLAYLPIFIGVFVVFLIYRVWGFMATKPWQIILRPNDLAFRQQFARRVWTHRNATTVIGLAFLTLVITERHWSYTDVLTELAHKGMASSLLWHFILFSTLLAGAIYGGWSIGRWRHRVPTFGALASCLLGGSLMAFGGQLIPGSNDALLLSGMPMLWAYAWIAFAVMCLTVAIVQAPIIFGWVKPLGAQLQD